MDELIKYIQQNPVTAISAAALLMLIAGFIIRRLKFIAIILIIVASFVFYIFLNTDKTGKIKIEEIKKKVKNKVMENI